MRSNESALTREMLIAAVDYDPETGIFTWKSKASGGDSILIGGVAGWPDNGYIRMSLYNNKYVAHRLAWLYFYGKWPEEEVDHINMDRSDNRICNLRAATKSENMRNRGKQKNNSTGFKGVSRHYDGIRFTAQIHLNRRKKHLGVFDTAEEAHAAYVAACPIHHGDHGRTC